MTDRFGSNLPLFDFNANPLQLATESRLPKSKVPINENYFLSNFLVKKPLLSMLSINSNMYEKNLFANVSNTNHQDS